MTARRLPSTRYLAFPFRIGATGAEEAGRQRHVRDQVEQVLFTIPRERLFRPEFGIGVQQFLFEPLAEPVWELARKRLLSALTDALQGEVDPRTIDVHVATGAPAAGEASEGRLEITIRYQLATVGERIEERFVIDRGSVPHG